MLLTAVIATPLAEFVVILPSTVVFEEELTVSEDSGAVPPTAPQKVTAPTPPVTVRLRDVLSELMVDLNSISPEVAPEDTTRLAVNIA